MNICPESEIVGLAGTGKSTLVKETTERGDQDLPLPKTWFFWSLGRDPHYGTSGFKSDAEDFTREELISLGCIDAWLPYIQSMNSSGNSIAVLDPGSIYWLTKLKRFGVTGTGRSWYQCWWEAKFEEWSTAVDLLIWLDAPEELCLQRILSRDQWHDAKEMTSTEALGRFRALRKSYEQIILQMVSKRPRKVFHFLTDQISTQEIVDRIFAEVPLGPSGQNRTIEKRRANEPSDCTTQPHINNSPFITG
jgi:adenylate kinase family enzyme